MGIVQINEQTCTKCGACVSACELGLIGREENGYPFSTSASEFCVKCGACVAICPSGSLNHQYMSINDLALTDTSLKVNFNQMSQLLRSRRSIRAFKDRPVPRDEIIKLIDAVRYAPTAANVQEVKWLIIDDAEKLNKLRELGAKFWIESLERLQGFPGIDEIVGIYKKRKESGYDIIFHSAPAIVVTYAEETNAMASIDCTIALSYFDLAANSIGLGCCWLGFFSNDVNNYPSLKESMSIPEGYRIYGCLTVGYPKYSYSRIPVRNPSNITWL